MKKKNAGFSLVELIIVIAIMAILVGVMAPQLIKYIEKTNVSADTQFCDTIHSAIITTLSDPDIVTSQDSYDQGWVEDFTDPNNDFRLDSHGLGYLTCDFAVNVKEIVGVDVFQNCTQVMPYLKSKPAKTNGILCVHVNDTGSDFVIYIAHSDRTGKGRDINPRNADDIEEAIHAPEK